MDPTGFQLEALFKRRNFSGLMSLYESNYHRFLRLAPGVRELGRPLVSRVVGGLDLHLRVLEQTPYTTVLHLTYYFGRDDDAVADPDMQVRLYHDARLAEVLNCCRRPVEGRGIPELDKLYRGVLNRKWEVNHFLDRWLAYCLAQGHRFGRTAARKESPVLADT
jgi:uncharacterized protein YqiB (DUF1249 family)